MVTKFVELDSADGNGTVFIDVMKIRTVRRAFSSKPATLISFDNEHIEQVDGNPEDIMLKIQR